MRFVSPLILLCLTGTLCAQSTVPPITLPNAPTPVLLAYATPSPNPTSDPALAAVSSSAHYLDEVSASLQANQQPATVPPPNAAPGQAVDAQGNPIPLERYQPHRLLGIMPNFRTVSAGAKVPPPGWKYNFTVATHQATDYSTFIILGLTSMFAEGTNEHPSLRKGVDGYYRYVWRGFLDKTDGTYLSAWLLPSLLHEDTRYYPLGSGHSIVLRELYVISREGVARTYGGHQTPNIAGLGGKVLAQEISKSYYPSSASTFGELSEKFGYSIMRDLISANIREFYPDIAAHYIRKHREKVARQAAQDAVASGVKS